MRLQLQQHFSLSLCVSKLLLLQGPGMLHQVKTASWNPFFLALLGAQSFCIIRVVCMPHLCCNSCEGSGWVEQVCHMGPWNDLEVGCLVFLHVSHVWAFGRGVCMSNLCFNVFWRIGLSRIVIRVIDMICKLGVSCVSILFDEVIAWVIIFVTIRLQVQGFLLGGADPLCFVGNLISWGCLVFRNDNLWTKILWRVRERICGPGSC